MVSKDDDYVNLCPWQTVGEDSFYSFEILQSEYQLPITERNGPRCFDTFCILFFGRLECVGHSFANVAHL
jgi:hypothetical protein